MDTQVHEVFAITEKAPTGAFYWLKAPISAFTGIYQDKMINRHLNMVKYT